MAVNELAQILANLSQIGLIIGITALGFGLVLKGVSVKTATPVLRFGGYTTAGALVIMFAASGL